MENLNKVKSYFGLSVRARKVAIGTNEILEKDVFVIVASKSLSENAKNKIMNHIDRKKTKFFAISEEEMFSITDNSNILAFGITDKGLANAIEKNI